jgi:hypothetical protein
MRLVVLIGVNIKTNQIRQSSQKDMARLFYIGKKYTVHI